MENKKRGRPPKKEEKKDLYKVTDNFFYKGAQFHVGQEIGYNESLVKLGKIKKIEKKIKEEIEI